MFCVLSLIILVAAFNIASSLIMLVRAKNRDIAILRTMGATRADDADLHDGRHHDRRTRDRPRTDPRLHRASFPSALSSSRPAVSGQNLWDPSIRFLAELASKTNPVEAIAIVLIIAAADLPRDALSRVQGGEH